MHQLALKRRCDGNFANAAAAELLVSDAIKRQKARLEKTEEEAAKRNGSKASMDALPDMELLPEDFAEPLIPRDQVFKGLVAIDNVQKQLRPILTKVRLLPSTCLVLAPCSVALLAFPALPARNALPAQPFSPMCSHRRQHDCVRSVPQVDTALKMNRNPWVRAALRGRLQLTPCAASWRPPPCAAWAP